MHVPVPDPPRVTLAKIFMVTPNPANPRKLIIKEWDGKNPEYPLIVYAHIENGTYSSYVTLSDHQKRQLEFFTERDPRYDENYTRLMHNSWPVSEYFQSCIHNPRAHDPDRYPNCPQLETLIRNLMSGTLSFVNSREIRDRHRIYVFDPDRTLGLKSKRHFDVMKPEFTYWYKLNNLSGRDQITEGPPDDETIREITKDEFDLNYKIFSKFNIANPNTFLLNREFGQLGKRPEGIRKPTKPTRYLHTHPRPTPRGGGKKHSKRRNKTRRKYRKIKSRRRIP
jgi:hypothetical protein